MAGRMSVAVDSDLERIAHLAHLAVSQASESFDENSDRHALDRVEIGNARSRYGILAGLEGDFTGELADRRCARSNERSAKARDRRVSRQHDDRATTDLGKLAPPHLAPLRRTHDAAAASRNDARLPHSSSVSSGVSS